MIAVTRKAPARFSYIGLLLTYLLIVIIACSPGQTTAPSSPPANDKCSASTTSTSNQTESTPAIGLADRYAVMTSQYTEGGSREGSLKAITAVSASDIWAVGNTNSSALIEHWNGSTWRIVPTPDPGAGNQAVLYAITAVSANDIWTVGRYSIGTTPTFKTLIEHWNGSTWRIVPSPNVQGYQQNVLEGIVAISANNVWAVGTGFVNRPQDQQANQRIGYCTLIEHWDGSSWTILPHSQMDGGLRGVAAISSNNVWAVGDFYDSSFCDTNPMCSPQVLIEHWNGQSWSTIPSGL